MSIQGLWNITYILLAWCVAYFLFAPPDLFFALTYPRAHVLCLLVEFSQWGVLEGDWRKRVFISEAFLLWGHFGLVVCLTDDLCFSQGDSLSFSRLLGFGKCSLSFSLWTTLLSFYTISAFSLDVKFLFSFQEHPFGSNPHPLLQGLAQDSDLAQYPPW